jgi:hypothetical protein
MSPKTQEIVDELKVWCDQEVGRESLVAKVLGVGPEEVMNWFAGEREPTSEQILLIQEFLAKQKNWDKSAWVFGVSEKHRPQSDLLVTSDRAFFLVAAELEKGFTLQVLPGFELPVLPNAVMRSSLAHFLKPTFRE